MKKLELDAFCNYRFLSELSYAPGGKHAACVVTTADKEENKYQSAIWILGKDGRKQLTGLGKERGFIWEDENHILFAAARSAKEQKRAEAGSPAMTMYRMDIRGGEAMPAFTLPIGGGDFKKLPDGKWLFNAQIDADYPDYYLLSEEEREKINREKKDNADYEVFTEIPFYGNGRGFVDKKRSAFFTYNPEDGALKRLTGPELDVWGAEIADAETVYFVGCPAETRPDGGVGMLYRMNPQTGELRRIDLGNLEVRLVKLVNGEVIIAASEAKVYEMSDDPSFYRVCPETGALTRLTGPLGLGNSTGCDCRYGGTHSVRTANGSLYFLATVRNDCNLYRLGSDGTVETVAARTGSIDDFTVNEAGEMLLIGLYDNKLQEIYDDSFNCLTDFNTEVLKDVYVADPEPMTIQSRGWDIDGWVLKPVDYDPEKKYPAIIDIHGGPRTVFGTAFFHEMQYWANCGYFVFFCNPVGGSGRGLEFANITAKYGSIDFDNLMDFTDAVLEKYPQIDAKRVGCTGGSYGGFMSNWILGHTDRFAAVATQRSISNWISFYGVSDIGWFFDKSQMGADIYSDEGVMKLWSFSPLRYVKNMKTPTLFIHSNEDYRCPMEQGMQLFTAMKEQGIPVRMCYFRGENHELSRSGKPLHRIRRLQEITDWMNKYCSE